MTDNVEVTPAGTQASSTDGSPADSSGGTQGAGAPPSSPPPSFRDSWPDEYKVDPVFKNFNSPEDLLKSYKHAASMVGMDKTEVIRKPRADATPEEVSQFYDSIGRPKTIDDYKLPDVKDVEFDKELVSQYRKAAYENGYTQKQFETSLAFVAEISRREAAAELAARNEAVAKGDQELRSKWGDAYNDKVQAVRKAVGHFGGEDLQKALIETGLVNNPQMADALAALGESLREDVAFGKSFGGGGERPLTPQEATLEWNSMKLDRNVNKALFDKNDPGHLAAVQKREQLFKYMYPEKKK